MQYSRRQDDRRRRVLMTSGAATATVPGTAARHRIEQLREARQPQAAYGSRVRKCLRGRWYSLVPVSRTALAKTWASLAFAVIVLIVFHDATERYAAIQSRPEWAKVFQIDQYGSLGRYFTSLIYLLLAATAWLTYQLRRYRNDDFSGDYRLWQWIVGCSVACSIATVVPILSLMGSCLETVLGKRVALSGEDWLSLFLIFGAAILAMRTVAEMWRYRMCVLILAIGWAMMTIPVAADWNVMRIDTIGRWTVASSAPMVAASFWFAATLGYLRSLYREVRGIEPSVGFLVGIRSMSRSLRPPEEPTAAADKHEANKTIVKQPATKSPSTKQRPKPAAATASVDVASTAETHPAADSNEKAEPITKKSRFAFWRRSEKSPSPANVTAEITTHADAREQDASKPSRSNSEKLNDVGETQADEPKPVRRRFGLGSIMNRKAKPDPAPETEKEATSGTVRDVERQPQRPVASDSSDDDDSYDSADDDSGDIDEDGIDWSSLNKAERRRMRKQLKRGGKAA